MFFLNINGSFVLSFVFFVICIGFVYKLWIKGFLDCEMFVIYNIIVIVKDKGKFVFFVFVYVLVFVVDVNDGVLIFFKLNY